MITSTFRRTPATLGQCAGCGQDATAMYDWPPRRQRGLYSILPPAARHQLSRSAAWRREISHADRQPTPPTRQETSGEIRILLLPIAPELTFSWRRAKIVNAIPFPASSGWVLFARRPTGGTQHDRSSIQQHQFDGYRHHWGREEFGDLAELGARLRRPAPHQPTSPGVPRAADQHGQSHYRTNYAARASFGRDARRGTIGQMSVPPPEGARNHHRQGRSMPPNSHTARRRRPPLVPGLPGMPASGAERAWCPDTAYH